MNDVIEVFFKTNLSLEIIDLDFKGDKVWEIILEDDSTLTEPYISQINGFLVSAKIQLIINNTKLKNLELAEWTINPKEPINQVLDLRIKFTNCTIKNIWLKGCIDPKHLYEKNKVINVRTSHNYGIEGIKCCLITIENSGTIISSGVANLLSVRNETKLENIKIEDTFSIKSLSIIDFYKLKLSLQEKNKILNSCNKLIGKIPSESWTNLNYNYQFISASKNWFKFILFFIHRNYSSIKCSSFSLISSLILLSYSFSITSLSYDKFLYFHIPPAFIFELIVTNINLELECNPILALKIIFIIISYSLSIYTAFSFLFTLKNKFGFKPLKYSQNKDE